MSRVPRDIQERVDAYALRNGVDTTPTNAGRAANDRHRLARIIGEIEDDLRDVVRPLQGMSRNELSERLLFDCLNCGLDRASQMRAVAAAFAILAKHHGMDQDGASELLEQALDIAEVPS